MKIYLVVSFFTLFLLFFYQLILQQMMFLYFILVYHTFFLGIYEERNLIQDFNIFKEQHVLLNA